MQGVCVDSTCFDTEGIRKGVLDADATWRRRLQVRARQSRSRTLLTWEKIRDSISAGRQKTAAERSGVASRSFVRSDVSSRGCSELDGYRGRSTVHWQEQPDLPWRCNILRLSGRRGVHTFCFWYPKIGGIATERWLSAMWNATKCFC